MSFLQLEGLHVFVTGAAGGIGSSIVTEFLAQGCSVTGHDLRQNTALAPSPRLHVVQGDISDESSIEKCMTDARERFGPIHILAANAGITDESNEYPIWEMPAELWDRTYAVNVRGTFLTIKHFLRSADICQKEAKAELPNLAIVVTGSECGKFGQAGHVEYASGKAGLQYGLVRSVKNEIVRLNSAARINAVAPGWVDTPLIEGRLDDPKEMYREAQATVPLQKIAKPTDVARTVAFLASHRAAGHISGQCISVDGGMEGRIVWSESEIGQRTEDVQLARPIITEATSSIPIPLVSAQKSRPSIKIAVSIDFDAVSGWLGTGTSLENNLSDYSSGFFSALVGVPRLLKLFKRLGIADKTTWFVPMHSAESFPEQFKAILDSGCELGLHGYCHEGAPQLTPDQERDVLEHCIAIATKLSGRKPRGYRAPLYQLRETTIDLLEEHGFLYDSSLSHHDSKPYHIPRLPPITQPSFTPEASAREWMHPLSQPESPTSTTLVEVPGSWYVEDMTPLQFWPHTPNSQGYVDVRLIERMWMDRFEFLRGELAEQDGDELIVFPLVLHPDTSGMAHVIGMIERILNWLQGWEDEVEFMTFETIAEIWKKGERNKI
ncbi:polysaccharide deacetylase family protein-like protein [Mytilinidion resinicola]|uniref:Polysaccharide deacetylase family protein-like protein n=1 Tax=Mytilinidion resinicola TaxID=574789 RepID=A0A6A6YMB5_9PEZI|nr:polysaccharide deacetylase family protein-like protein [Mytilinidion resinicola]KAF2809689.1 polysaccharide deacetylase family protein-like protein [Mytilinidion resinicola]